MTRTISEAREALVVAVVTEPGRSTRELAEHLAQTHRNTLTDLNALAKAGRIERWWDGLESRWFPPW
jgi:predicted transcriptional regulator